MKCPSCKTHEQHTGVDLHAEGFSEDILTCKICGAVWSINHGATLIINDPQEHSFLEAVGDSVEADDYGFIAA
jgi:uncharacterized Zn finger protein